MQTLRLDKIRVDGGTQTRASVSMDTAQEYANALSDGATFPAVTVFYDGSEYWLADGFHRFQAHRILDWLEVEADVKQGTRRDAVLFSVGANASHGLRRTNADKRRAVETLLNDAEWTGWSNREIARRCGVDDKTVAALRPKLSAELPQIERTVARNGATYTQNTSNIGKRPEPAPINRAPTPAPPPVMPEPIWPEHDAETGEIVQAAPTYNMPSDLPAEVWQAGQRPVPTETPYTRLHDDLAAAGESPRAQDFHRALNRLLEFERDGAALLATPYAAQMGMQRAARGVAELLERWLEHEPVTASGRRVVTIEAN